LLVYTSLYIFNINWCTARVGVGLAYLQNAMQDSACPSSLHKNRSFSREVTYAQRESLGFSCGSLNFKATKIVAQTSTTMKAAHASWKMDFSILISTCVSVSCFLFIFCFSVYICHISKVYRLWRFIVVEQLDFFPKYIETDKKRLLNWRSIEYF